MHLTPWRFQGRSQPFPPTIIVLVATCMFNLVFYILGRIGVLPWRLFRICSGITHVQFWTIDIIGLYIVLWLLFGFITIFTQSVTRLVLYSCEDFNILTPGIMVVLHTHESRLLDESIIWIYMILRVVTILRTRDLRGIKLRNEIYNIHA